MTSIHPYQSNGHNTLCRECGTLRDSQRHLHRFVPSRSDPETCICELPLVADVHANDRPELILA